MSELTSYYYYEDRVITPATHQYCVYHADEADKVIAELKKEKQYVIENTAKVINAHEREIRHQKYKRCLAMASLSLEKRETYRAEYEEWCLKWYKRWLELAEKFNGVK